MKLKIIDGFFAVCKVTALDATQIQQEFTFIANTDEELSLVCKEQSLPSNTTSLEKGYRLIRIDDVLDFSLVGILAKISGILASHNISIFVISTFNTDYFLIKNNQFDETTRLLKINGYHF